MLIDISLLHLEDQCRHIEIAFRLPPLQVCSLKYQLHFTSSKLSDEGKRWISRLVGPPFCRSKRPHWGTRGLPPSLWTFNDMRRVWWKWMHVLPKAYLVQVRDIDSIINMTLFILFFSPASTHTRKLYQWDYIIWRSLSRNEGLPHIKVFVSDTLKAPSSEHINRLNIFSPEKSSKGLSISILTRINLYI